MQLTTVFLLIVLSVVHTLALHVYDNNQDRETGGYQRYGKETAEVKDYYDPPQYTYEYRVDDYKNSDYKRHRESRQGGEVKGYYSLMDADGSLRVVRYTADDKNGFNAIVTKTKPGEQVPYNDQEQ